MTPSLDRLYELLPVVYRLRDADYGQPLRDLLRVIAEQVDIVEADITQLYDNWFIETCQDWVVPYIGDLLGYTPVHEAGEPGDVRTLRERQLNKILIPRRDVANTIHNRRIIPPHARSNRGRADRRSQRSRRGDLQSVQRRELQCRSVRSSAVPQWRDPNVPVVAAVPGFAQLYPAAESRRSNRRSS